MSRTLGFVFFWLVFSFCSLTSCEKLPAITINHKEQCPTVEVISLTRKQLERKLQIPSELIPFESVDIYPKVEGFINAIYVDKGSFVKNGELLINLTAPELEDQIQEAKAKLQSDEGIYKRLKAASETPGVISENELDIANKAMEASSAHLQFLEKTKEYLQVRAPFDGVITQRNVHTGALVGPSGAGASVPLLHIEKVSRLRLVVPIPERDVSGVSLGNKVDFTVSAFPDKVFTATVSRIPHSINTKTRTEEVELDFDNSKRELSSGMYAEVEWKVKRPYPTFFIPSSAVVTTTEKTFIIRVKDNTVEWVDVTLGGSVENLIEIFGDIKEGEGIISKATDELQEGSKVNPKMEKGYK